MILRLQQWAVSWLGYLDFLLSLFLYHPSHSQPSLGSWRLEDCVGEKIEFQLQDSWIQAFWVGEHILLCIGCLWLSWFSCAYLCRGESTHFPWATWAVAYSTCSIHYSSSIHFQNLPSSHRTSSVLTIINLHKNVFVFFYDYFSRLSEGKGNNMWVQSAIFLWNAIG